MRKDIINTLRSTFSRAYIEISGQSLERNKKLFWYFALKFAYRKNFAQLENEILGDEKLLFRNDVRTGTFFEIKMVSRMKERQEEPPEK